MHTAYIDVTNRNQVVWKRMVISAELINLGSVRVPGIIPM